MPSLCLQIRILMDLSKHCIQGFLVVQYFERLNFVGNIVKFTNYFLMDCYSNRFLSHFFHGEFTFEFWGTRDIVSKCELFYGPVLDGFH